MMNTLKKWATILHPNSLKSYAQQYEKSASKNGCDWNTEKGANEMMTFDEKDMRKAELRRLIRNLGMKYASANYKAQNPNDPFGIYHFGQAMAYEEAIEIIKKLFSDEMKEEDWA